MTTASVEHLDLERTWRRLEEAYERHTELLADLSTSDGTADDAADVARRDRVIAGSRETLTDIALAIQAMVEGRYGLCRACSSQIDPEFLTACPHAAYCMQCAEPGGHADSDVRPLVRPRHRGRARATRRASLRVLRPAS